MSVEMVPDLRPAVAEDDPGIVRLHATQEPDGQPLVLERYRGEQAEGAADGGERYVAIADGRLVGAASFRWAWWTGQRTAYEETVRVDAGRRRHGIGARLHETLLAQMLSLGATRLVGFIRADAADGRAFAARCGFREAGQAVREYHLDISRAVTDPYANLVDRLRGEGVRIVSLSELAWEDEAFLSALQQVWADSGDRPPDPDRLRDSFAAWQFQVLRAWGLSSGTHWVAVEGDRPIGMTFLKRISDDAYENDYTGTASTHRRRGIATALKLCAIRWARHEGVRWFWTSSEVGNRAMIDLNARLGYVPGVTRIEVACDLG